MEIAFIGLGNMGGPMALNLIKAGHHLRVFDLSAAATEAPKRRARKSRRMPRRQSLASRS